MEILTLLVGNSVVSDALAGPRRHLLPRRGPGARASLVRRYHDRGRWRGEFVPSARTGGATRALLAKVLRTGDTVTWLDPYGDPENDTRASSRELRR